MMTGNASARPHPAVLRMLHQNDVIVWTRDVEMFRWTVVPGVRADVRVCCTDRDSDN